jgi:multidrug efflux pump subunit AcrB
VNSQIQQGQASITMEFEIDRNIDAALTEVQSKLSNVELPSGADAPTIVKSNPEDQPIVLLSASSPKRDMHALTEFLELNVVDQLKILPGVGEVTLAGYQQRNLRVWVDNNKLKPLQLTILDVKSALSTEQVEEAAGLSGKFAERIQRPHHGRRRHAGGSRQPPDQEARRRGNLQLQHPHQGCRARRGRPR